MNELYTKTDIRTDVIKLQDAYNALKTSEQWHELFKDRKHTYNYEYFCKFVEANEEYISCYHDRIKLRA